MKDVASQHQPMLCGNGEENKKRADASAKLSIVHLTRSMAKNSANRNLNILPGRPAITIILCIDTSEQTHHRSPIRSYQLLLSQLGEPYVYNQPRLAN